MGLGSKSGWVDRHRDGIYQCMCDHILLPSLSPLGDVMTEWTMEYPISLTKEAIKTRRTSKGKRLQRRQPVYAEGYALNIILKAAISSGLIPYADRGLLQWQVERSRYPLCRRLTEDGR